MTAPATVAIPIELHEAIYDWAMMGFEDFGDHFFDLVEAAMDAGYGERARLHEMAYSRIELVVDRDESTPF